MRYSLICNSTLEHLPKDKNMCFLGYWCLEHSKNAFQDLSKYKIINDYDKNDKQTNEDVNNIQQIYLSLISDLIKFLNNLHNKKFSKKFWEIVAGPWLKVFIGIVYERYTSLEKALNDDEINHLILAEYSSYDLSTNNVDDLENKACKNTNEWNTILYTQIFEFLNTSHSFTKTKFQKNTNFKIKKNIKFKSLFLKMLGLINTINHRKKEYFIYKTDIKLKDILLLYLHLKQLPQIPLEINYKHKEINPVLRKKFKFAKKITKKIENFIRQILPVTLPTDIIENFQNLFDIAKNANWPQSPRVILTSSAYHDDEIFKLYLAQKVEQKSFYVAHQHGSNYFTGKNTIIQPDFNTCDKFLSWGNIKEKNCHTLFNTKNIYIKKIKENSGKKILFFAHKMSSLRKRPHDDYGQMIRYNITLEKILFNLNQDIQKNAVIKTHSNNYESEKLENKILEEILFKRNKYNIDRSSINNQLIEESKILVSLSDGTAFLESMAIGIPTICILSNLNWIREEARNDYKKLIDGKILFINPKDASDHINKVYYNVENWWNNKQVQEIRKIFCDKYSKPAPINSLKQIASTLKNIV